MTGNRFAPRVYGDCRAIHLGTPANACDATACRYHLAATGAAFTCALAFVDAHPDGATADAIAPLFGVCRERVRQIEYAATRVMREALADEGER